MNVALGQNRILEGLVDAELVVELQATDLTQVVPLRVEEQVVEQIVGRVQRRWVTGSEALVDLKDRFVGRLDLVDHAVLRRKGPT